VGEAVLTVLAEREFPIAKLYALGSGASEDNTVMFAERPLLVEALADFDFKRCQLALFCVPAAVAAQYVPSAVKAGCLVVDASTAFRSDATVPIVVQEVNADVLAVRPAGAIVASPGAPAVQLASVLAPLARAVGLKRVQVTTLLSVSAFGRAGVSELAGQTARLLNAQGAKRQIFPAQIAFNLIPQFDAVDESGYTLDELQVAAEVKKLLADEELVVDAKSVFAAVFYGHSQVISIETRAPLTAAAARKLLVKAAGVKMLDKAADHVSPVADSTGSNEVLVGRIAQGSGREHELTLWVVADNIRKGAAVNIVQIAETLIKSHL
jgi:aspartate-semialdehyde dehydrogenase